ncbi:MAG: hypothetical protein R3D67_14205 [Hyphomicrobiaceae bacterium]
METFLDHLMQAESGGRDTAANPRSTALGPFQFIESTFIEVSRRHFPADTEKLANGELLRLRTTGHSRGGQLEAYTRDGHLRSSRPSCRTSPICVWHFSRMPGRGGARLAGPRRYPLAIRVVGAAVVQANPFMAGMTTSEPYSLVQEQLAGSEIAAAEIKGNPAWKVRKAEALPSTWCDRGLASCRRWIALARQRVARKVANGSLPRRRR